MAIGRCRQAKNFQTMKSEMSARSKSASSRARVSTRLIGVSLILAVLPLIFSASAQVTVKTLGGGPVVVGGPAYGFVNGPTLQESQFDNPFGCALDSAGNLFIADRDNGQIRKLNIVADKASTYLSGLNLPVAVAIDAANNLYVASQGDGTIRKFDSFGNPIATVSGLSAPTAIALDGSTNIYVTELGGAVKRISPTGNVTPLANGFNQPRGVAVMDSGAIAVSENHAIRLIDPITLNLSYLAGSNAPGFTNGPGLLARFNQPHQLAKAPNGSLVVADRMNHRVRVVTTNGITTTLYGIEPDAWASDYPGWEDGSVEFAEAREPVGVTIAKDGTVYSTEVFYHLIRKITGAGLSATISGGPGGPG